MEILAKLNAAADQCESGEEVNLDELSFLLRYAAEELQETADIREQREQLLANLRERLLARCDLLSRSEPDLQTARDGTFEQLTELEEKLDRELRVRFRDDHDFEETTESTASPSLVEFRSGRE